jgi:hypothetical protein
MQALQCNLGQGLHSLNIEGRKSVEGTPKWRQYKGTFQRGRMIFLMLSLKDLLCNFVLTQGLRNLTSEFLQLILSKGV